ncbi:MAG: septum site-determining protein minD [Frankiales bacterium]|nr:septum site-determining protein minD [Frankiales bacterium]
MTARPLVLTNDPDALDELLRLAATAGVEVDVAPDVTAARRWWAAAPMVVIGADQVDRCADGRLARRDGVVILGDDLDDGSIWQRAVVVGAEQVVFLPDAEAWLISALADAVELKHDDGALVAVIGGRGGAGATTLACALALTAVRRGLQSLLVDADPLGGGVDLVFGGELADGLRWPDLALTRGRLQGQVLAEALPRFEDLVVLSCARADPEPLPLESVRAVLGAARRTNDLVVVDLPRSFDEVSCALLADATATFLVVPAEVRATAAAGRVAVRVAALCPDLRLVVRGPAPIGLAPEDVGRALGLRVAGAVRAEPGLEAALDRGEPPATRPRSPLSSLCHVLLDDLLGTALSRSA